MKNVIVLVLASVCFPLMLAGCSTVRISVAANKSLNRDINGMPSPVAVRIVHFQSLPEFLAASWPQLTEHFPGETHYLEPGQVAQWSVALPDSAPYVGIAADLRQREGRTWKCYQRLPDDHPRWLTEWGLFIDQNGLQVNEEGACQR